MRVLNKGRLDSLGADLRIEKEIGTLALGRVLNKGRRDSLSADLRIEKEQGRVADRSETATQREVRLARLRFADLGVGVFLSPCILGVRMRIMPRARCIQCTCKIMAKHSMNM